MEAGGNAGAIAVDACPGIKADATKPAGEPSHASPASSSSSSFSVANDADPGRYFRHGQRVLLQDDAESSGGRWSPAVIVNIRDTAHGNARLPFMRLVLVQRLNSATPPRWVPCCSTRLRLPHRPVPATDVDPTHLVPGRTLEVMKTLLTMAAQARRLGKAFLAASCECRALQCLLHQCNSRKQQAGDTKQGAECAAKSLLRLALHYWFTSVCPMLQLELGRAVQIHASVGHAPAHDGGTALLNRMAIRSELAADVVAWRNLMAAMTRSVEGEIDDDVDVAYLKTTPMQATLPSILARWSSSNTKDSV